MEPAYVKGISTGYNDIQTDSASNTELVKNILLILYIFIPIAAGANKFLNLLTNWTKYLNPLVTDITGISEVIFMNIAGAVEIAAGIFVILNKRIGAYIISFWLLAIAFQLIIGGMYLDVAVRDIAMAAGAFCLARLSENKK